MCGDSLLELYASHIYISFRKMYPFFLVQYIFLYWKSVSMCVFKNQIKAAVAANRSARCCCVWYEYEMTLKYMLCRPGKHPILCVHLTRVTYHFPGDMFIMVISPWVDWKSVFVSAFGVPLQGYPAPTCTHIHTNCMVAPCSMPCLFHYSNYWLYFNQHPSFSINV